MSYYYYIATALLLSTIITFCATMKRPRIVKLDAMPESLWWTLALMRWKYVFPTSCEDFEGSKDSQTEDRLYCWRVWEFLRPFFASRGYRLFQASTTSDALFPQNLPAPAQNSAYPYARRIHSKSAPETIWASPRTWYARNKAGQDVVIKLISDLSQPSHELFVLKRLNNPKLRSHSQNHTIYVIEFLTFDNLVFVVMPRWDHAFAADFGTVSELMHITKTFLEVFDVLHKNRIVHHDFVVQNTGMNAFMNFRDLLGAKGLRNPDEVKYALYDFDNSIAYPEDVALENVVATRPLNYQLHRLPEIVGPYNPFKADVAFLGSELQLYVRHIENIVPEIGPFFDNMVNMMNEKQFTAAQALERFSEIYDSLTPSQLQEPVTTFSWQQGKSQRKRVYRR